MSSVMIPNLPLIGSPTLSGLTVFDQAGVTYKISFTQIQSLLGFFGGVLPLAFGGTGSALVADNGAIPYSDSSKIVLTSPANYAHLVTSNSGIPFLSTTGAILVTQVTIAATQQMETNIGYIANNAALVTFTLPLTAAVGTMLSIQGLSASGWLIAQNASQIIHVGATPSTAGVTGSVASTNRYDSLNLICVVADLEWAVLGKEQGTLTVV